MGKSSRHKSQNVHHFVPFSDRILNVNTDVIHQIRRTGDEGENETIFFGEALLKWTDLDLTEDFLNFRKEIQGQVQTFEQLVHHKDGIIASLKKHLAVPKSLAVSALLDLVVQLARDLQQEFVPHFQDFFNILVKLLTDYSQDAEVLEQIFQTFACLFRFLWRYLVKEFTTVFSYFSQLMQPSQKDHIKVFAAESCAYLLRKVKHQDELLNVLFGSLKAQPELVDGVGLLLFQMLKGVNNRFHTISEKAFPLILQKLGAWNPDERNKIRLPYDSVEQAVKVLMQECANHTTKEFCKPLWEIMLAVVNQVHTAYLRSRSENVDGNVELIQHLCRLLRLISVWLTFNSGNIVSDAEHIADTLCTIIKSLCPAQHLDEDVLCAISNLLQTSHDRLSVGTIYRLNSVVFNVPFPFSVLKSFVKDVLNLPFFEKDVLPGLMTRLHSLLTSENDEEKKEMLAFVVEIVLQKVKPPLTGEDLHLLKPYCHDNSRSKSIKDNSFSTYIGSILASTSDRSKSLSAADLSLLWGAVVCAPHFCASGLQTISLLWKELVHQIEHCHDEDLREMMLAVLNQMLRSMLINLHENELNTIPVDYADILNMVRLRPSSPFSVQMMDLYLSCDQNSSLLTEDHLRELYTLLEPLLVSPSNKLRLITSHLFSIFPVDLPDYNDGLTREGVFKIMYHAEKIVPNVHSYREKLIHLRKLEYNCIVKCLPSEFYRKTPLLFLLGNEFWNFKLMWEPLAELISSHAHGLDAEEFWGVMLNQLHKAAQGSAQKLETKAAHCDDQETITNLFTSHTTNFFKDTRQPDFTNFRIQLWKAMKMFPDRCILRSDALCELYLSFLKNEFFAADEDSISCQNILQSNRSKCDIQIEDSQAETTMDVVMEDDEEKPHVDTHAVEENESISVRRKPAIQSLLVHLDLIAKFKKQRSMFLQPQVQNSFYDLLKHRNSSVQKAAFECVLSYKNPHIVPYKDNFYRLLDDKTFKTEIVLFRVDEESTEIKEADRDELLPVLMRILYGKFHCKTGTDTSGKSRSNLRKSIVFSFLCGCKPEELIYFLKLLFQPFMHFVTDDPVKMVNTTLMNMNFEKFIPLKRIKGVLNTVQSVSRKLGHRMVNFAHPLLHILLGLTTTISAALTHREEVLKGAVNLLKTLFHTVINRITQFFENFEDLDYTFEEIDAVFKVVVWPLAQKLATEGIHHPTPILKLFLFWSQSKRFFPLLGHVKDSSSAVVCTPMASIISLLRAPKINAKVEVAIMDLINNLLIIEDIDDEPQTKALPLPFADFRGREEKKAGEHMLLQHIGSIIMYLKGSLSKVTSGLLKTRQKFNTELKILGRVSSVVTLPEECHALCELLISLFARGITLSQDMEENVLLSFTNMIQYISKPEVFYRDVSQLFCSVERRESRIQLCKLFRVISEKDPCLINYVTLIEKLNAWDRRKAEEPDYFTRLEAFAEINSRVSNMEMVTVDILLPVMYNCCYFINHVDDMSIRDNSTHCLVCIIKCLAQATTEDCRKTFNIVIEKALLPQIKLGIRHKSEAVRHEFITLLQNLVNSCPNNDMFTGLKDLCDKDTEADFFENIRHIQIHKRSRGLRRLYKHLKDHHFRAEIHMSYFIPLVYAFITDPSYSSHANLQDAAIDLLGAICKQLPWQHYIQLLRFYLYLLPKKIELQRQLVRVIVALLDAFHFDLRNSSYNIIITPAAVASNNMESLDEEMQQEDVIVNVEQPSEVEASQTPSYLLEAVVVPDENEKTDEIVICGSDIVCSPAAATRIHKTIVISLLPHLHRVVTHKAKSDDEHKLVRSKYPEDDEILRVPLALAMIKLLQHLPGGTLENTLPGILLKICVFLRSRSRDVRTSARDTIEKVALSLGARYLPFLLRELKGTLTRGYQLHVLGFTAFRLLKVLSSNMKPGDLDPALTTVQDIFYSELFGQTADEKEVEAIKAKYFEAQFIKAYDAYQLLATYVSSRSVNQLVQPIKGVLESTHNRHIANKAEVVLQKVANGLMANSSIPIETMMVFIKCWITQSTSSIVQQSKQKSKNADSKEKLQHRLPESCLLLPEAAPRGGFKPKASKETNTHVLVEFGLQLLHMCLKKSLLLPNEHLHLQLLDPLIPAIQECLKSSHIKTTANCMRCLSWILKFPLPSLKANINKIVPDMFVVLRNYTGAATAKGGNQELITVCFKAVTVLVRDVAYYGITEDQLKVLLTYCEEDIYNYSRQSSAFNLIRAILSRKLDIPQLHQVMDRLFEMSITASSTNVRLHSRQVILHYLLNYPMGKGLKKHLHYYIDNLNYELEEGRESAIEMMITIFSAFPQSVLNNHCVKFFVALAMASFNDASAKCRKLIMVALRTLIGKIEVKQRKALFADVIKWMKSDVIDVCTMGSHVCGIFVEVEGGKFESYLTDIIPLLQLQLNPNKYTNKMEEEDSLKTEQQDMCLVAAVNSFLKIMKELPLGRQENLKAELNEIWGHVHSHLLYPHSQVRLLCSQLLGLLFSSWEPEEVAKQQMKTCESSDENQTPFYMMQDTLQLVQDCTKSFCQQLQTPNLDDILGTQVVKNILYLARLAEALERSDILVRITRKVMNEANIEVINNVKVTLRRNYAFKWTAALAMSLNAASVITLLPHVLPPLQREIVATTQDESLKNLAQEVLDLLKKQVGVPEFTAAFAKCHKWRQDKRDRKKRDNAAVAVTNPDIAARKKIRHNLKKRVAAKRKIEEKKPTKRIKKNKLSILNVVVEDD